MKICRVGDTLTVACRWTDAAKLLVAFRDYTNAPKHRHVGVCSSCLSPFSTRTVYEVSLQNTVTVMSVIRWAALFFFARTTFKECIPVAT